MQRSYRQKQIKNQIHKIEQGTGFHTLLISSHSNREFLSPDILVHNQKPAFSTPLLTPRKYSQKL